MVGRDDTAEPAKIYGRESIEVTNLNFTRKEIGLGILLGLAIQVIIILLGLMLGIPSKGY
jgi:hypothetical protein